MKNYKKMYKRLVKEIKDSQKSEVKYGTHKINSREDILDYCETRYALSVYDVLFQIIDEVSGKKHHNMVMSKDEFKDWKKEKL